MRKTNNKLIKTTSTNVVTETTLICDCCGKESYDDGEIKFGGCIHRDYIHVSKRVSLARQIQGTPNNWDFCSEECMVKYFNMNG